MKKLFLTRLLSKNERLLRIFVKLLSYFDEFCDLRHFNTTDKDDVAETTEGLETREIVTKQIITTTTDATDEDKKSEDGVQETTEDPNVSETLETSEIPETVTEAITTTTEVTRENEKEDRDLQIYIILTNVAFTIAVVASFAIVYFYVVTFLIRDSHKVVKILFLKSRDEDDDDRIMLVIS
jgi:lysozyme family protein